MATLQRPPYVYQRGALTPWDEATIHIGSEALIRGISVFEGVKGYWRHDGSGFNLLALREHYERLLRSARLQHLPFSHTYEEFADACILLTSKLLTNDKDCWLRPTIFSVEGQWGEHTITDLVITCYNQDQKRPEPLALGVSTWQRPLDTGLPARMKSAANYQIGRLARIEGRRQGFADMILLNTWGRVAEATGSCVLMVRDGRVITPPPSEGALESITVNIIAALCEQRGIPFERRPVERTELLCADELCLAGTLMELGPVMRFEDRDMPAQRPVLSALADDYWAHVREERVSPAVNLTPVA